MLVFALRCLGRALPCRTRAWVALQERSEWSAEKQRLQKEVEQLHELVEYLLDQYEVPVEEQEGADDDSEATVALADPDHAGASLPIPRIPIEALAQTHTIDSGPIFSP